MGNDNKSLTIKYNDILAGILERGITDELWYYEYIVTHYDEISNENISSKGVISATSYTDAMQKLEDYYGDELCSVDLLYCCSQFVYEFGGYDSKFNIKKEDIVND